MKIYQIYYDKRSKSYIKDCFTPYNNTHGNSEEYEYGVMRKLYRTHDWDKDSHLGVLSWKFESKIKHYHGGPTKFVSSDFVSVCNKNKDSYDVFHMNPSAVDGINPWVRGEMFHPGMVATMLDILPKIGISPYLIHLHHNYHTLCYCNYWVANKKFWDDYMSVTERVYAYLKENPCYDSTGVNMFAYIMERLFSSVLKFNIEKFKVLPLGLANLQLPPAALSVSPGNRTDLSEFLT